jgi:exopolysaccharide/PEP-CTERM locus tyrosine autokinase
MNLEALLAAGFVVPNAPRSPLQDQYRAIKRPLIQNATGQGASMPTHGNLVIVTSALPGEGKTFNSINLALSIAAELDHSVLLVDADVANPSVFRALGIDEGVSAGSSGLLDVLGGRCALSDSLLKTNVDKLMLLPGGGFHAHATELLASEAMRALLDDLATCDPERIVIFDSPPLLPTTEAATLASHMGQIVVVVQAEKTQRKAVQNALAMIEACPVRLLLLNQARKAPDQGYGGYGYGYGYGAARRYPSPGTAEAHKDAS